MDCSHWAPLFMGFSRQEYWDGLPFPSPGDLPNPGTEPTSLVSALQADSLPAEPLGKIWMQLKLTYRSMTCIFSFILVKNCKDGSTLAWKIPWTEEPGELQSMGSLGVGHD